MCQTLNKKRSTNPVDLNKMKACKRKIRPKKENEMKKVQPDFCATLIDLQRRKLRVVVHV